MEHRPIGGPANPRDPAVLCADIQRAFAVGEWVVVCWEPACPMHRLIGWGEEEWVAMSRQQDYARYTHGICPEHMQLLMEEIEAIEKLLEIPVSQTRDKF